MLWFVEAGCGWLLFYGRSGMVVPGTNVPAGLLLLGLLKGN